MTLKSLSCDKLFELQLKTKFKKYLYWLTLLGINFISLFFKLKDINFVEYKYDQYFADNVIQNCKIKLLNFSNLEFLYIRSSLIYFLELFLLLKILDPNLYFL